MTQFLLSVHHDYTRPLQEPGTDIEQMQAAVGELNQALQESGAWVFAGGLLPPESATVVDGSSGSLEVTEGPRAHAVLHMGGFWVIEAQDVEAAESWAVRASRAIHGPVEVRPFQG